MADPCCQMMRFNSRTLRADLSDAETPDALIEYNPNLDLYALVGAGEMRAAIFHCPWCGHPLPKGRSPPGVMITVALEGGVSTVGPDGEQLNLADLIARLSEPDDEEEP